MTIGSAPLAPSPLGPLGCMAKMTDVDLETDKIAGELGKSLVSFLRKAPFDFRLTFPRSALTESLSEGLE